MSLHRDRKQEENKHAKHKPSADGCQGNQLRKLSFGPFFHLRNFFKDLLRCSGAQVNIQTAKSRCIQSHDKEERFVIGINISSNTENFF